MSDQHLTENLERLSLSTAPGCPSCNGVQPRLCHCRGYTMLKDWYNTLDGWLHITEIRRRAS